VEEAKEDTEKKELDKKLKNFATEEAVDKKVKAVLERLRNEN